MRHEDILNACIGWLGVVVLIEQEGGAPGSTGEAWDPAMLIAYSPQLNALAMREAECHLDMCGVRLGLFGKISRIQRDEAIVRVT